jgi:uncharacterized membrane protein YfhO
MLQFDEDNPANEKIAGFKYIGGESGYSIFENQHYVPMGFTYDYYTDSENVDDRTLEAKSRILSKAVVLDKEQIEKYDDILKPLLSSDVPHMKEQYYEACDKLAEETCDSFSYDNKGFKASITLDEPKLVFFSIPYMDGFTATVNGNPVDIEKVNYGLMAVRAEEGNNEIVFAYETPGLKTGLIVSGIGGLILICLLVSPLIIKKKTNE